MLGCTGEDPGCGSLGSGEGAGRRQPEGKGRLAGAGDWQRATALVNVQQTVPGIKLLPANRTEANLGSGAADQAVLLSTVSVLRGRRVRVGRQEAFCVNGAVASPWLEATGPVFLTTWRYCEWHTAPLLFASTLTARESISYLLTPTPS